MYCAKPPCAKQGDSMDCIDIIRQGVGRELTEDEVTTLFEQVKKEKKRIQNSVNAGDMEASLMQAVEKYADKTEITALAKKRALQMQAIVRAKAVDTVLNTFRGKEEDGLSALLTGTSYARTGARLSIDAVGQSFEGFYIGGLLNDIAELGAAHEKLFNSGALDLEVSRALKSLDGPDAQPYKGPREALGIAKVIKKWQESARTRQNNAGAWIGKELGYIVRQSHERSKIRAAGFEQWKKDIADRLDWTRTADGAFGFGESPDEFLRQAYDDIVTGVHIAPGPRDASLTRTETIGSAAARVSQERVLHFKDADAWFEYNQQYGRGNLREAVMSGLQSAARSTALMRGLGPSPQENFDAMFSDVVQTLFLRGDTDGVIRVNKSRNRLYNQLKEVDGTLNIEGNAIIAQVGRSFRMLESMNKLGGVVVSALPDISLFSSEMAYHGKSFLGRMGQGIASMLEGRGTDDQRRILSSLGVFFDGMAGDLTARFSGDELPGRMSRMMQVFFKYNGLNWWTDTWRKITGLMLSHDLALEKGLHWNGLSVERRRVLDLYGIDADSWDLIRQGNTRAADGREYLTPEGLNDVKEKDLAKVLLNRGKEPTEQRISDLRDEIATQLRTYFRDRIDYAVINPDAKTRSILRRGTSAGTFEGELIRFVMQFKSFPVAVLQRTWGRELHGRGADTRFGFLNNQHGEIKGLAQMILFTTLFGYGAMTAKDMLKGRSPRDPKDAKTWLAAALQGGALGIYGDFLFGERNRQGGGIVSSLAGPTAGTIDEINNIYTRIRDGEDVGANLLRFAINHTPGNNMWWFRTAFDYTIAYNLFENINPGYFNRMRRRVEKENSQQFWMRPVQW